MPKLTWDEMRALEKQQREAQRKAARSAGAAKRAARRPPPRLCSSPECRERAMTGKPWCRDHKPKRRECVGISGDGFKCMKPARDGHDTCWWHRDFVPFPERKDEAGMTEVIEVRVGQVWADNDPRCKGRTLRVEEVREGFAHCVAISETKPSGAGVKTRIAVSRMLGRAFTLISEPEG